jgi:murein DD-endopeptidase MepM/ murein hydrolase activator NlpD
MDLGMHMIRIQAQPRKPDKWGSGEFGASRGERTHTGKDFACAVGSHILAPCIGKVSKLGHPYEDALEFRYVEITRQDGLRFRVFYVEPLVAKGDFVDFDTVIGVSQTLGSRYPKITEHVHFEIKDESGQVINPETILGWR